MKFANLDDVVNWNEELKNNASNSIKGVERSDIERQCMTSNEIVKRLRSDDYPAVILGDEVGMGKTFVALATISTVLASSKSARALLILPNSDILRKKWQQDINSFQENYIKEQYKDTFRAAEVTSLMDLLCTTNDYKNTNMQRIGNEDAIRYAFLWEFLEFRNGNKSLFTKWLRKFNISEKKKWQFEDAYQTVSPLALRRYFEHTRLDLFYTELNSEKGMPRLNERIKEFLNTQEDYLPNLFIIRMNKLAFPQKNNEQMRTFGSALVDVLCRGREDKTICDVLSALQDSFIWPLDQLGYSRMCSSYLNDFRSLPEPFGLEKYLRSEEGRKLLEEFRLEDKTKGTVTWRSLYDSLRTGEDDALAHKFLCALRGKIVRQMLTRVKFSLCVVDEAHNWKSGETHGAKDYKELLQGIIPKVLLLSATPFQIDPLEFKTIFETAVTPGKSSKTALALDKLYSEDNGLVLKSIEKSKRFHEAWSKLNANDMEELHRKLNSAIDTYQIKNALHEITLDFGNSLQLISFCKEAVEYASTLKNLESALRLLMIRHTKEKTRLMTGKRSSNRHFHSGISYLKNPRHKVTKQISRIPATSGYTSDMEELALFEFMAMRFDQLLREEANGNAKKSDRKKSAAAHLMNGLTSSFSAFEESQKSKQSSLIASPEIDTYRECLNRISTKGKLLHPKVEATCERLIANWELGRKTLVFCYRVATVNEIVTTVNERIEKKLKELTRNYSFLNEDLPKTLGRQYLFREDRLWFSILLTNLPDGTSLYESKWYKETRSFLESKEIANHLSEAAERFGRTKSDRIRRLMWEIDAICLKHFLFEAPLKDLKVPDWIKELTNNRSITDLVEIFERASVSRRPNSDTIAVEDTHEEIHEEPTKRSHQAREDASSAFIERYFKNASIWFSQNKEATKSLSSFHKSLWMLWTDEVQVLIKNKTNDSLDADLAFWLRNQILKAVRNVILRYDLVVRLLTHSSSVNQLKSNGELSDYLHLLSEKAFTLELGGQTIMKRVTDYLEELLKATGSIDMQVREESRRRALFSGALLRHSQGEPTAIKSITGEVGGEKRGQICQAFNSPLLPDALVCTSIGQEGIDLHLYCAEVIHHDLPWNPAVLEQRTGRVDRVRSLAERDNSLLIQIGLPFLGNNYDQYQYDVLVERAQKFDILMGDESIKNDWQEAEREIQDETRIDNLEKSSVNSVGSGILPESLIGYLSLDLSVWRR